jgi:hypothetical protein
MTQMADDDDLPLNDTFARFTGPEVDVTIAGNTFKAQVGMIGDGHGTPIEAGIVVLRVASDIAAVDWFADRLGLKRKSGGGR